MGVFFRIKATRQTAPVSPVARAASQSTINILRIFPFRRLLLDQMMLRREVADRIGAASVARERESLAAAAAEIDVAALAAARVGSWCRGRH
jgi:hypothetical protein